MASKNKQMMARTAEEYAEDIATTAEIVRGWAKQMFEDAVNRRYRKVRDTAQKIGQTMTRFDAELAKPIIASRPGEKDMMAASDMTTPEAIAKMMEAWNKIEAQAKKQFPNASKEELYRITKSAFESALKFKFSRPGAKATFKIEDGFYFGKGRKERFADDVTYSIAAHVGHEPVGHRSVRSLEEAKAIAKQMLASTKANAKGKPVLVEVYPVVNYSPKDAIVTLRG